MRDVGSQNQTHFAQWKKSLPRSPILYSGWINGGALNGFVFCTIIYECYFWRPHAAAQKKAAPGALLRSWQNAGMVDVKVTTFMALDEVERIAIWRAGSLLELRGRAP